MTKTLHQRDIQIIEPHITGGRILLTYEILRRIALRPYLPPDQPSFQA